MPHQWSSPSGVSGSFPASPRASRRHHRRRGASSTSRWRRSLLSSRRSDHDAPPQQRRPVGWRRPRGAAANLCTGAKVCARVTEKSWGVHPDSLASEGGRKARHREGAVADSSDGSWTRALMASSGISVGHRDMPAHASAELRAAADRSTPLARLQKLAVSGDEEVRAAVARRPDCPLGLLAALAHDRRADVRVAVAGNPRLTDAISHHLRGDRDARVLKALARNDVIAPDVLESLALHRKSEVRRVASREIDARWGTGDAPASAEKPAPGLPLELRDRVRSSPTPAWDGVQTTPGTAETPASRPALTVNPLVT